MRKITLLFATLFVLTTSIAQHINLEQFSSETCFPEEINHDASKKIKNTYKKYLELYKDEKVKYNKEQFIYETNYFLNNLNRSGHVFFDDEISVYLNNLKSIILEGDELDHKINVYLTDFPYLNAFTNDFGNIYVNIYAVAALDSEEQIMYLLAHEIAHVKMRHSHKTMEFHQKIKEKETWDEEEDEMRYKRHEFSREHEFEADSIALTLLKTKVNPSHCIDLLTELKNSGDPVLKSEKSIKLTSPKNQQIFDSLLLSLKSDSLFFPIPNSDTMSTHPSVENRITRIKAFINLNNSNYNYTPINKHKEIKLLAAFVLIDSYIENYYHLEAFDLIQKLLVLYPNNKALKKQLAQSVTLMIQSKYEGSIYSRYLNDSECSDLPYLALKKLFLTLSATDLNVIGMDILNTINEDVQNEWKYSNQYFYKYNPALFIQPVDSVSLSQYTYDMDILASYQFLDTAETRFKEEENEKKEDIFYDEITPLDSLIKLGYVYISPNDTCLFLRNYISLNPINKVQDSLITAYEEKKGLFKRRKFNEELDDLLMHPGYAHRKFFRGKYEQNTFLLESKKSLLLSMDNLFFDSKSMKKFRLNEKKSLDLNSKMIPIYKKYSTVNKDLSIQLDNQYSLADLFARKKILKWLNTSTDRNELQYVPEDEYVANYFKENDIENLVYTILVVNKNKRRGHMTNLNFYDVYINTKNNSLAYYARISSQEWPTIFHLEQLVYLSTKNRK